LSGDDIVFNDVAYRQPRRLRRPDRDPGRACIAYGTPRDGDLPIFLDHGPADRIERHALSDTSVELGGILLGWECVDDQTGAPFVWITQALPAEHYENSQASFTYTHESWAQITRERDERYPDLDIVGWYHTHPDFGIFLSSHDLFIHHHFFGQPLQVAYVVDPIRQQRGFFQWRGEQVEPVGGVCLLDRRNRRTALARFVNDLENLADPEAESTGLSPRLEAQLMALATRPHTVMAPASGAGALALVGLTGALLGMLLLAAGLWINTLAQSVKDQTAAVAALQRTVAQRPEDLATARLAAKERVLDGLLGNIQVDDQSRQDLRRAYQQVVAERDTARSEVETLVTDKAALSALSTTLRTERADLDAQLIAAREELGRLKASDAVKRLDTQIRTLQDREKELGGLLAQAQAGTLLRRYNVAWYVAAAASGLSVLLGLGLVWAIARSSPDRNVGTDT
jgi:proteasome lid subunit RPN8/RPN11